MIPRYGFYRSFLMGVDYHTARSTLQIACDGVRSFHSRRRGRVSIEHPVETNQQWDAATYDRCNTTTAPR